jgi:hypothetical protein
MDFNDYLISKNIATSVFKEQDENMFSTWETAFLQMHPNSFTEQYKFQLNKIRRKYPLKTEF